MSIDLTTAFAEAKELIDDTANLVRVVLSGQRKSMKPTFSRIDIRPVLIKGQMMLQVSSHDGRQMTTANFEPSDLPTMEMLESGFANVLVEHREGSMSLRVTKKHGAQIHHEKSKNEQDLAHDRVKNRFLAATDPFLREVGISDESGRIKPTRQDKYRQVEEFLRLLAPTLISAIESGHLDAPTVAKPIRVADLGCGNAYLTFATHQYLQNNNFPVHVTGIDIRTESRERNTEIASRLGIESTIDFRAEDISSNTLKSADLVIALHACDTATDDAIAWAVLHDAKLLFIAPCCHHELQTQLVDVPEPWQAVTRHGLLKERMADLLTDALRAQILKLLGYRTDVIEFVGGEHTPRNLMIRSTKTNAPVDPLDLERYRELIAQWKIKPALAVLLDEKLDEISNA